MTPEQIEKEFWWVIRHYESGDKSEEELLRLLVKVYTDAYEVGAADFREGITR